MQQDHPDTPGVVSYLLLFCVEYAVATPYIHFAVIVDIARTHTLFIAVWIFKDDIIAGHIVVIIVVYQLIRYGKVDPSLLSIIPGVRTNCITVNNILAILMNFVDTTEH